MKAIRFAILIAVAVAASDWLLSCSDDVIAGGNNINENEFELDMIEIPTTSEFNLVPAENAICSTIDEIGLQALKALIKEGSGENIAISSLSASAAAALYEITINYCYGSPNGLQDMLKYESIDDAHSTFNKLMRFLPDKSNGSNVIIGNSIWLNNRIYIPEELKEIASSKYYADIYQFVVGDDWLSNASRKWVDVKTLGEYDDIELDSEIETRAYTINTVYFKGEWKTKFDCELTHSRVFHAQEGDSEAEFMAGDFYEDVSCLVTEDWTAVALPFEGNYEMTFVLPAEGVALVDAVEALSAENVGKFKASAPLSLKIPKFNFKNERYISDYIPVRPEVNLYQYTSVAVDEDGAKAVAVTIGFDDVIEELVFDRPFLYSVFNRVSGTSLMIGAVMDPSHTGESE